MNPVKKTNHWIAFALLIYFRLIKTLGSMGVASQAYLRAAIAVALGVIFLDERSHWLWE